MTVKQKKTPSVPLVVIEDRGWVDPEAAREFERELERRRREEEEFDRELEEMIGRGELAVDPKTGRVRRVR